MGENLALVSFNQSKMPVKRSRIGSPSGQQAMQISTADAATVNSSAIRKADEPSKILDIECPVGVGESDQVKIGGFLERCYYCKKRIAQNSEVFMYRYTFQCAVCFFFLYFGK